MIGRLEIGQEGETYEVITREALSEVQLAWRANALWSGAVVGTGFWLFTPPKKLPGLVFTEMAFAGAGAGRLVEYFVLEHEAGTATVLPWGLGGVLTFIGSALGGGIAGYAFARKTKNPIHAILGPLAGIGLAETLLAGIEFLILKGRGA